MITTRPDRQTDRLLIKKRSRSRPDLNRGTFMLPPPKREQFETQEQFEEAKGRWQETVGRNRGIWEMIERNRRLRNEKKQDE